MDLIIMSDNSWLNIRYENLAGALLLIAGVLAFMGIITAEALYPGYSTSKNTISDLGASLPPNSIIIEPSATIFDTAMVVSGILTIITSYFIQRSYRKKAVSSSIGLFGVGALGVGIFNGSYGDIHAIFAILAFLMGGLAAIISYRIQKFPMNYLSIILGGIALLDLLLYYILGQESPFWVLGIGGLERWVAYPILLWGIGFGGYLMGTCSDK
jgi:hypothetical membrane protein